jgi:hypothetical protein
MVPPEKSAYTKEGNLNSGASQSGLGEQTQQAKRQSGKYAYLTTRPQLA